MARLDGQGKSRPERDSIPQPTVSCYINYAIPTTENVIGPFKVFTEQRSNSKQEQY
jgi:hypothetical protein